MRWVHTGIVAALTAFAPLPLHAQWHAEARLGRLDFRFDPAAAPATTSLGAGVGFDGVDGWLGLSAGIPLGEEDPLWAAAEAGRRVALEFGPLILGVDVAGQGFIQRYAHRLERPGGLFEPPTLTEGHETGYGLAGQVLPLAGVSAGIVSLQARAGQSWYRTALGSRQATRSTSLAELQLAFQPTLAARAAVEGRQYWAGDGRYTYAGVSGAWSFPVLTVSGSIGRWLEPSNQQIPWSAAVAVPFAQRFELRLQARSDALDPLYGSLPRRTWAAGLRVAFGERGRAEPPVPASYESGRARIELPAGDAPGQPRIAGDFNDWTPEPMTRAGERWVFVVALEPGVYEYAFVDRDGTWFVPPSTPGRRDDGMGGHVALLVVGGAE